MRLLQSLKHRGVESLFTSPGSAETGIYKITSTDNYRRGLEAGLLYADSKGMRQDRVAALREANIYERQAYRHLVGLPAILGEVDGEPKRLPSRPLRLRGSGT